jgi:hypothetical protein
MTSLLKKDARAIFQMIGSSRVAGKAGDIFRRHRCIVDDDARCFGPGLGGLRHDIVQLCCGQLGDSGDVVEKGKQIRSCE